jgi:omega-amidase
MEVLKITLIQSNLYWEDKEKNLSMFSEKISGIREETDLILLPEMFSTGFSMNAASLAEKMNGPSIQWMKKTAVEKNCVIAGSMIIEENGKYFNRLIWMKPDDHEYYDKRHLFSLAGEEKTYKAGENKITVLLKGWRILPLICYDLRFPVWSRRSKKSDYDVLLYLANWPEKRIYAWKQLLIARAIENQSYTVGLNRYGNDGNQILHSGDSAVIDYTGEIMNKEKNLGEFTKTYSLSKEPQDIFRKQFAFFSDSDNFEIIL